MIMTNRHVVKWNGSDIDGHAGFHILFQDDRKITKNLSHVTVYCYGDRKADAT
jgi:hypothetical protein